MFNCFFTTDHSPALKGDACSSWWRCSEIFWDGFACGLTLLCAYFPSQMSREEVAVRRARAAFRSGRTKPLDFRVHQLKNLLRFISERSADIAAAAKDDLGKVGDEPLWLPGWDVGK